MNPATPLPPERDAAPNDWALTYDELVSRITSSWQEPVSLARVCSEGASLADMITDIGNAHFAALLDGSTTLRDPVEHKFYTFVWPDLAKRFLNLWRNCAIEWEHYLVLLLEEQRNEQTGQVLAEAFRQKLLVAADAWLRAGTVDALGNLRSNQPHRERCLFEWSLQNNPWPVFRNQFETLNKQFGAIQQGSDNRLAAANAVDQLRRYVIDLPEQLLGQYQTVLEGVARAKEILLDENANTISRISTTRLQQLETVELSDARLDTISHATAALVDALPERCIFYAVTGEGRVLLRDLALESEAGQWISSELIPEVQRATRVVETAAAEFSRSLVDIRNRVTLAREVDSAEAPTGGLADSSEPTAVHRLVELLDGVHERISARQIEIETIGGYLRTLAQRELRLSRAYDSSLGFLEVSFEGSVSRIRGQQSEVFTAIASWFDAQINKLRRLTRRALGAEDLSIGERIIRTIQSRRPDPANDSYTSVLAARGFIGEAFHAGRENELARAVAAVEAWRSGFRGSVLVTGRRYSGKTHFVELIAGRHFENRLIRLLPKQQIDFAGRRLAPTADLAEALGFVRKYTSGQRLLVLIDDLELWCDRDHSLAANADALREALDTSSNRLMFLVTTSNWIMGHIAAATDLSGAFHVQINLDRMPVEDFVSTAIIRHAAHTYERHRQGGQAGGGVGAPGACSAAARDCARQRWRWPATLGAGHGNGRFDDGAAA